jgi:hypothetical protein
MPSFSVNLWLQEELERAACVYVQNLVRNQHPELEGRICAKFERFAYGQFEVSWDAEPGLEESGWEYVSLAALLRDYLGKVPS